MTALPNVLLDQPALTKLIWLRLCTSPELSQTHDEHLESLAEGVNR